MIDPSHIHENAKASMGERLRQNVNKVYEEYIMSNRAEEWKKIAKDLSEALRRCSWQCSDIGHHKGQFHTHDEECPVNAKIGAAYEAYNEKMNQESKSL